MTQIGNIEKFKTGQAAQVKRHNATIHTVNYLNRKQNEEIVISRRRASGGVYGVVVRGLVGADASREPDAVPPPEGFGEYIIRLESDATPEWNALTEYVADAEVLSPADDRKYKSLTGTTETPNVGNDPTDSPTDWELLPEINPVHFDHGVVSDWRVYAPWVGTGTAIPLLKKGEHYYFAQQMILLKAPTSRQSLVWDEDNARLMAVFA